MARGLHTAAELKVKELLERVGAAGLAEAAAELAEDPTEQLLGVDVALVGPLGPALQKQQVGSFSLAYPFKDGHLHRRCFYYLFNQAAVKSAWIAILFHPHSPPPR